MAKGNKYWDRALSLVDGCTKCSPGCLNCWSEEIYGRFHQDSLISPEKKWTGEIICNHARLSIPKRARKPAVFAVWNDLAHPSVPDTFRAMAFKEMVIHTQHRYLLLTKRIHELVASLRMNLRQGEFHHIYPGRSIFPGVTVCTQEEADKNIPELLRLKEFFPWMRVWVSLEPILEEIKLNKICGTFGNGNVRPWCDVDTIVIGGESGSPKKARPIKEEWFQSVLDDCRAAGVPVFVKQMGTWWAKNTEIRNVIFKERGKTPYQCRDRQGADMRYWPVALRVRELIWRGRKEIIAW
ncbi:MAG: DUF5131 family protein [Desulfobacterales bacterium]|nr:DUF5131 family protein [Desulfobacterales bacterium]